MKKIIQHLHLVVLATLVILTGGCDNNSSDDTPSMAIGLVSPADNASIDINTDRFPYEFKWEFSGAATKCDLKFSVTNIFSADNTYAFECLSGTSKEVSEKEWADILEKLGITQNETGTVFWTVVTSGEIDPEKQVRKIEATGYTTPLLTPADGNPIKLEYGKAGEQATTFSWADRGKDNYELVIGATADLSHNIVSIPVSAGTSVTLTHEQMQESLIDSDEVGLARYNVNENVYWNVKAGGNFIATTAGKFSLQGMPVFIDKRGDETIVYPVAVLEYNDATHIWLGENLRATKDVDGNELGSYIPFDYTVRVDNSGYMGYPARSSTDQWSSGAFNGSGTLIPDELRRKMGVFYNCGKADLIQKIVPEGWELPTSRQFRDLFNAAQEAGGGKYDVLRDGEWYDYESHYFNQWNMNMVPTGRWKWYYQSFVDYNEVGNYIISPATSNNKFVTINVQNWSTGEFNDTSDSDNSGAPVRLIYTGR